MPLFKLIPYPADQIPNISISVDVERNENRLSFIYAVQGDIDKILLPKPSGSTRQDDLWKATCFEFFIAIKNQSLYWEFNMSPSSKWNVYAMDAYRQVNMREEMAFTQLPFEFKITNKEVTLDISVDLNPIAQPKDILEIGVTTIIQTDNGNESYWALAHPGPHADFHLRDSFILSF